MNAVVQFNYSNKCLLARHLGILLNALQTYEDNGTKKKLTSESSLVRRKLTSEKKTN